MHENKILLNLNNRGIFPGPHEQDASFLKRGFKEKKTLVPPKTLEITNKLFNAQPDWVEIQRGGRDLYPWEGAATWIEEDEELGRRATVQIKNSFLSRFYPLEETIAHELVHAMRLMFDERRFEEILAFRTSQNSLRRYLGPLFSQACETIGFVLVMALSWLWCLAEMVFDLSLGASYGIWLPVAVLGFGVVRLARSQAIFSRALEQLEKVIKEPCLSLAVALRLTDEEIEHFAKCSLGEIISYVEDEKKNNLRWQQLAAAYFE